MTIINDKIFQGFKKKVLYLRYQNVRKILAETAYNVLPKKPKNLTAVTGTNGKSTTSKLLYDILKKHNYDVRLLGNIGKPLLSEKNINPKTIFVIEASSYQIEYSNNFNANYAAILNISPDHLERHKNIKNYVKVKSKIFFAQKKSESHNSITSHRIASSKPI